MRRFACCISLFIAPFLAAQDNEGDEIFELSPFTVEATEDTGYRATSTLAGTRLRTDLRDVGSAISVITKEFLQDTGVTDNESLLIYTTNTETGGVQGNYAGLGGGERLQEGGAMLRPNSNNRVRGLNSADNTRNYMLTDIPWDNYIVDRVDLQRGPNSILFGLGSPSGIINATLTGANFRDSSKAEFRFGSWGSIRGSVSLNRVLVEDQLAVRVAALTDREKFQQDPAFEDDERIYLAFKWEPKLLKSDSARTTITGNYENGEIESNRPRTLPPEDRLTPWFTRMDQAVYDPFFAYNYYEDVPRSGTNVAGSPNRDTSVFQLFGGNQIYFADPNSGSQQGIIRVGEFAATTKRGLGPDGNVDQNVNMLPFWRSVSIAGHSDYAEQEGLPFSTTLAPFKAQSLTDRSIFDFKNHLIDGPNKREYRDFDAVNFKLNQTFLDDRIGFEIAYDQQGYGDRSFRPYGSNPILTVDINTKLPTDLIDNPNVGRPYIYNRTRFGTGARQTDREVMQATAFADVRFHDFMDDSWASKLLGRHVFTAFASNQDIEQRDQQWSSYMMDRDFGEFQAVPGIQMAERELMLMSYLGDSMIGRNLSNISVSPITAVQTVPAAQTIRLFDATWNATGVAFDDPWIQPFTGEESTQSENGGNYIGFTDRSYTVLSGATAAEGVLSTEKANRQLDEIESHSFVWQGFLWDGALVPTYGYRKDEAVSYSTNLNSSDLHIDLTDGSYELPSTANNVVEGESHSWSVVLHWDTLFGELPGGMQFSTFWNTSSNFQPAAGRINHVAEPLDAPSGETEDYGFVVSAFEGRAHLKVNWYETNVANASFDPGNLWVMGAQEARAIKAAKQFEANLNGEPGADNWYYRPRDGQTEEEALAEQRLHVDAVLSNQVSQAYYDAWGMDPVNGWTGNWWLGGGTPTGLTSTADTQSKGVEYELSVQPTKNWSVMINASEQTAQNTNLAGSLKEYVAARKAHWDGPAGDIRMWWGGGSSSIGAQFNQLFYSGYQLALQQEGTNVPEMRPWRFNLVSTYRFTEGRMNGVHVGGSLRWEDEVAIGYPVFTDTDGQDKFRIESPYWGPSRENFDLWAGYTRKLNDGKKWRIQLNLRNAFAKDELIPITVQGDGAPGTFRLPNSRQWTLTNTLEW